MQKLIVGSMVLVCCTLIWMASGMGKQVPTPRGELHIVDKTGRHRLMPEHNIESLVGIDRDGTIVLQLATGWQWQDDHTLILKLRQGVTFHNGEVFDAAVVKRNFDAYLSFRDFWGATRFWRAFPPGVRLDVLDASTVRLVLPKPDSTALVRLFLMRITNHEFYDTLKSPEGYFPKLRSAGP
jgi:ABC-type transport system substrate-binding protein